MMASFSVTIYKVGKCMMSSVLKSDRFEVLALTVVSFQVGYSLKDETDQERYVFGS